MIEANFQLKLQQFLLQADLNDGGLILLSGENGSGKTTFLKCLAGLYPVGSGTILVNGRDITSLEVQKRKVIYATQNSYFGHLTVDRHIAWPEKTGEHAVQIRELKDAFGIDFSGKLKDLSMGQKMRVTLATAFARHPDVILLDEVVSNISDPEGILREVKALSRRMSIDVIFVAHSAGIEQADHRYIMEYGVLRKVS